MQLLIDTTENQSQVILIKNGKILAQKSFKAHIEHSEKLLPEIEKLLETNKKRVAASFSLRDLDAIIVITGPGSFTGCRVGVATANALSFALNVPVVGISKGEIVNVGVAHLGARNDVGVAHFSARESIKEILKIAQKKLKSKKIKYALPFYAHPPHITKAKSIF